MPNRTRADDRKLRDTIEAKNKADAMVYNVEKTLKEHRGKIGEAGAKEIESALEETKKAIGENDPARINTAVDRLTAASHKLAEATSKMQRRPLGRMIQTGSMPPPTGSRPPATSWPRPCTSPLLRNPAPRHRLRTAEITAKEPAARRMWLTPSSSTSIDKQF